MHPDERSRDDQEQQPEAALPDAGQIVEGTEGDRQNEAAEAADETDDSADGADAIGVVDGDVLVDCCLAEAHEEAEHERNHDEAEQAHPRRELDRAADAFDDILRRRIGQDERANDRDDERPVHDRAGAIAVGEMSAVGTEQRCRD